MVALEDMSGPEGATDFDCNKMMGTNSTTRFSVFSSSEPTESTPAPAVPVQAEAPAAVVASKDEGEGADVDSLGAQVAKQGASVREMKKNGTAPEVVKEAVETLLRLKAELAAATLALGEQSTFDKKVFDQVVLRRMFIVPSFEIHGGVGGLFDLGPPACGLKANLVDAWRKHFVLQEGMLEMECTNLTPQSVLKTSGHVDRFTDLMVKDTKTGECLRADKLLEDHIDRLIDQTPAMPTLEREAHQRVQRQADAYSPEELGALLKEYGIKSTLGNDLTEPFPFNLMFKTHIGPEGTSVGFLRPETAQGLFVNFRRLLDYNQGKVPFAAAQVGLGFRNEISPQAGLLRVREFCLAEIEHFVNPQDKSHPRFKALAEKELVFFGADAQLDTGKTCTMAIGKAVASGLVNNETLGYFMARTQLFMEAIGMDPERMRFRQHLKTEMAHYACDCWDLEIKSSYGWVECVGHADRACYDLQVHAKATNTSMQANMTLDKPTKVTTVRAKLDRKQIGMKFKATQKKVIAALEGLAEDEASLKAFEEKLGTDGEAHLDVDGDACLIERSMVSWTRVESMTQDVKFLPSVIEPSFGMGRILYSLLEHSFYVREKDEQRSVFAFNALMAPIKVGVFPLSATPVFYPACDKLLAKLQEANISCKLDASGVAIGRKYSRADEIGIPFGVTVDFETLEDNTATVRERDTMLQIRVPLADIPSLIFDIIHSRDTWEAVLKRHPAAGGETEDGAATKTECTSRGNFSRPAVV